LRATIRNDVIRKSMKRLGAGFLSWLAISEKERGMEFVVAFFAAIWFLAALLAFGARKKYMIGR
jgi:hypothetical protein